MGVITSYSIHYTKLYEFGAIQMIDLHKRTLRRPGGTLFEIEYKNKYNQTVDMISDNYLFVDTINKW